MNVFKTIWNWLKELFINKYKQEVIDKEKLLKYLDKNLPNKKKFSLKDIIDKIKKII